jgi:Protein of unknown function (DUF1360)
VALGRLGGVGDQGPGPIRSARRPALGGAQGRSGGNVRRASDSHRAPRLIPLGRRAADPAAYPRALLGRAARVARHDVRPTTDTPTRPADYAALSAGWGTLLGALLLAARDKGEEPVRPAEVLPLGVATFALAKMVSKEKVEAWVREPFIEEHADGDRTPKGQGLRYAIGELLTCTRCVGMWSSLALVGLRVTRPREARVVNAVLGASAVNDWAQSGFNWLCAKANAQQASASEAEAGARRASQQAPFAR